MGKIYMIGSQKGGTAKTTTTFNLAYCLQKMGESIYYSLPVAEYSPKASAGMAYRKFAKELVSYEG